jgi:hypothetical protein
VGAAGFDAVSPTLKVDGPQTTLPPLAAMIEIS